MTDDYYAPVTSIEPVLIFSGDDDPVTPPSWGEHVAQHLPNVRSTSSCPAPATSR